MKDTLKQSLEKHYRDLMRNHEWNSGRKARRNPLQDSLEDYEMEPGRNLAKQKFVENYQEEFAEYSHTKIHVEGLICRIRYP